MSMETLIMSAVYRPHIAMALGLALLVGVSGCGRPTAAGHARTEPPRDPTAAVFDPAKPVRTAVIGGMVMTGLWDRIAHMYREESGQQVVVIVSGERPILAKALRAGDVDLLTMHSGDITTDLVADGYGVNMRPWTRNDLVILGVSQDPARVRGLNDGAEAFRRIANTRSNWVDSLSIGPREMAQGLWRSAGVTPVGDWVLKDGKGSEHGVLEFAAEHHAYVITGRMPVVFGKLSAPGMEVLVQGDPHMRRPYIVMEANPLYFPGTNAAGARRLAAFLLSERVQTFLRTDPSNQKDGVPFFYPVWAPPAAAPAAAAPTRS
jgi:tungstate transport system substrate-binding protein